MNILSVQNVSRLGRESQLFSDVSFGLEAGEKAALIGKNGCGKSTLLSVIAGTLPSDSGSVVMGRDCGFSYLPQTPVYNPEDTIKDHVFKSNSSRVKVIQNYFSVCHDLEKENDEKSVALLSSKLEKLTQEMDSLDLWNYENKIESILTTLGITDLDQTMKTLSGGMIKKVALAQVLIEDTGLLLLDEPTNHLDIETIDWLQDFLKNSSRAVLMVTHDRYFLDSVCSSIYEIELGELHLYKGNFSYYLQKKAEREELEAATNAKIETVLRREREWLLRGPCARGTKAKARIEAVHTMIDLRKNYSQKKAEKDKTFNFEVNGRRLGGKVLDVDNVSKGFNNKILIKEFSYLFKKGERIGVFGNNGAGKTTFLNLLTGTLSPDSGSVVPGDNTVFSYYKQNPELSANSSKSDEMTVLEYIRDESEYCKQNDGKNLSASQLLEKFGFEGKIQYSPITALSGGERKRLYLIRLLMRNPNFLILDEPTNDFDIYTMSVLESFLSEYTGCLLVVSHDRYFMDRVADTLFVLQPEGKISGFVGSCSEYLQVRKEEKLEKEKEIQKEKIEKYEAAKKQEKIIESKEKKKLTFNEKKEFETLEQKIEELESRKTELETLMGSGETDHVKLASWGKELTELSPILEKAYERWEYLASFC